MVDEFTTAGAEVVYSGLKPLILLAVAVEESYRLRHALFRSLLATAPKYDSRLIFRPA